MVIAIFFLHHLPDAELAELPHRLREQVTSPAVFYSLDPSRQRLSGAIGRLLIPKLMKRYQTEDERELEADATAALFQAAGWKTRTAMYDFGSSPLAGLFPGWARRLPHGADARRLRSKIAGPGAARQQL